MNLTNLLNRAKILFMAIPQFECKLYNDLMTLIHFRLLGYQIGRN